MDVKELMAFKPSQTPKRPAPGDPSKPHEEMMDDDPSDSYDARAKKRKMAMKKAQEVGVLFREAYYCIGFYISLQRETQLLCCCI